MGIFHSKSNFFAAQWGQITFTYLPAKMPHAEAAQLFLTNGNLELDTNMQSLHFDLLCVYCDLTLNFAGSSVIHGVQF